MELMSTILEIESLIKEKRNLSYSFLRLRIYVLFLLWCKFSLIRHLMSWLVNINFSFKKNPKIGMSAQTCAPMKYTSWVRR